MLESSICIKSSETWFIHAGTFEVTNLGLHRIHHVVISQPHKDLSVRKEPSAMLIETITDET